MNIANWGTRRVRNLSVFLATVIFVSVAAAYPAFAQDKPVRGGTIVGATVLEPKSLDPLFGDGGNLDHYVWRQIYESLLDITGSGEVGPGLATSWKFTEDKKSIDFTLRQGVKFHDGTAFNAEAAAVTFRRALSKELKRTAGLRICRRSLGWKCADPINADQSQGARARQRYRPSPSPA